MIKLIESIRKVYKVINVVKEIEIRESGSEIEIEFRGLCLRIGRREVEVVYDGLMMLEPKYLSMCLRAGNKTEEGREEVREKIERLKWLVENEGEGIDEEGEEEEGREDSREEGDKGGGGCRLPVRLL